MPISWLSMANFRNYEEESCCLTERTLVLGDNGQGKTNLLEAVSVLANGSSFRTWRDDDLVKWGQDLAVLRGVVASEGDRHVVDVTIPRGGPKTLRVDGKVFRRGGGFREPIVSFCPDDLRLVKGAPSDRRRYLDDVALRLYPALRQDLVEYARAVYQRNTLLYRLKQGRTGARSARPAATTVAPGQGPHTADPEAPGGAIALRELGPWDELVASLGGRIVAARLRVLAELVKHAVPRFALMMPPGERLTVGYACSAVPPPSTERGSGVPGAGAALCDASTVDTEDTLQGLSCVFSGLADDARPPESEALRPLLLSALARGHSADLARGTTSVGPHRDDVVFMLGGRVARLYASQGQQRAVVLAFKLAEVAVIEQHVHQAPIVLLDDVTSELDWARRSLLGAALGDAAQVVLATTDRAQVPPEMGPWETVLVVSDGHVRATVA